MASIGEHKDVFVCENENCQKPSTMQCPKCIEHNYPPSYFCSQKCFTDAWGVHKEKHKQYRKCGDYKPTDIPPIMSRVNYKGSLRPSQVSPMRYVPPQIQRPDYADEGLPISEMNVREFSIPVYSKEEIEGVRLASKLAREVLDVAGAMIRPGVTTEEIDRAVHFASIDRNCYPSPLNYHNFPKSVCTSINEVICHGIPDARPLQDGDIVNIDVTVYHKGFHGDLSETYFVGDNISEDSRHLVKSTYECLDLAIKAVKPGVRYRDLGDIIGKHASRNHLQVVRTYTGHGIGRLFHTAPTILHYAHNEARGVMKPGHIFTIEPMINQGNPKVFHWSDNWTATTTDGKRSAQFEHTLLVTEKGVEVLTARRGQASLFPSSFRPEPSSQL
eukprot:GCRY01002140.1.p1 GENE.GCRY01002140.1~~GCRY01002140.1.p1  ORF type:complete len:433 (-),score=66.32 GCRY01002140.1:121-1281(-)